jgi:hypothetical protein
MEKTVLLGKSKWTLWPQEFKKKMVAWRKKTKWMNILLVGSAGRVVLDVVAGIWKQRISRGGKGGAGDSKCGIMIWGLMWRDTPHLVLIHFVCVCVCVCVCGAGLQLRALHLLGSHSTTRFIIFDIRSHSKPRLAWIVILDSSIHTFWAAGMTGMHCHAGFYCLWWGFTNSLALNIDPPDLCLPNS